jgi:hypothetical protein
MPVFDAQGLDKASNLISLLGSFWANTYAGRRQVQEFLYARQQQNAQTHDNWNGALASLNPETVPVSQRHRWFPIRLLESQKIGLGRPAFGEDWQFTDPSQRNFDPAPYLGYPLQNVLKCRLLTDGIGGGQVTLRHGLDFHLDVANGQIIFTQDPFADSRLVPQVLLSPDAAQDRQLILWACGAEIDIQSVYRHFGIAFDLQMPSSDNSFQAMNALYAGLADGNPVLNLKQFLAALFGVPLTVAAEVVQDVFADARKQWVVTDTQTYGHPLTANITATVGDTLAVNQFMTNAITVQTFRGGKVPEDLPVLLLDERTLGEMYFQGLLFENKEVPLVITPNVDGYTKVTFELGGFTPDIDDFWNAIHAAGVAKQQTLAMLLDTRGAEATSQPTSLTLPTTVNPMKFLAENVYRNNGLLVRIKSSQLPASLNIKRQLRHLSKLIPAHVGLVVVAELAHSDAAVTIGGDGTTLQATADFNDICPLPGSTFRLRPTADFCS